MAHVLEKPHARILAGRLKNKKILLPADEHTRPTRERIRQAAFNMLESRITFDGLHVADICCGSGAWGLEALSRGAASVTLIDTHTKTAASNAKNLGVESQTTIHTGDARTFKPTTPFDVILADPPYGTDILESLIRNTAQWGKDGSWWVLECGSEETPNLNGLNCIKTQTYGITKLILARQERIES